MISNSSPINELPHQTGRCAIQYDEIRFEFECNSEHVRPKNNAMQPKFKFSRKNDIFRENLFQLKCTIDARHIVQF